MAEVPCFVEDLDDDAAFAGLVTANIQTPLHPLEKGRHVRAYLRRKGELGAGGGRGRRGGVREYARRFGAAEPTVRNWASAAELDENLATSCAVSAEQRK